MLEGVDGAGTTTHSKLLTQGLKQRGISAHGTREPSDGPIGVMLRQVLTGRLVVRSQEGPRSPSWSTMALLFAADRLDHIEAEVVPHLAAGTVVISDRYDYSSVAYQSSTAATEGNADDAVQWVKTLNHHARRPDLTLVLDIPAGSGGRAPPGTQRRSRALRR